MPPKMQVEVKRLMLQPNLARTAPAKAPPKKPAFDMASLFSAPGLKVNIPDINGEHDLYLVFKNDKAKPMEPLISLSDIKLSDVITAEKTKQ